MSSRKTYGNNLGLFVRWLNRRPGWQGVDARELLLMQKRIMAGDFSLIARRVGMSVEEFAEKVKRDEISETQYIVLELLQEYVNEFDRTFNTKLANYTAVRSFFMHNRCALPSDPAFKIHASKPPPVPKLAVEHVRDMVKAANLRDRSIILVKWQSMQDIERTVYVGKYLAEQVVTQIKEGIRPVRVDLPDRKRNKKPYYSFIGKDAVDALVAYFEKERGWPGPGEPIWLEKGEVPLSKTGFYHRWMALTRRVGLVPKKQGPLGSRYGYNSHEKRDIAKSFLQTHALKDGFEMDCAEFFMGHKPDKYGYDKFYNDFEYVKKEYLIAERYLNIISSPVDARRQEDQERIRQLESKLAKVEELEKTLLEIKQRLQA